MVSSSCPREGKLISSSKKAWFWGMISILRGLSRTLQMPVDEQASLVNPSAGSKHPPGIWIPHYWSSNRGSSCPLAPATGELARFQKGSSEAKDRKKERFQGYGAGGGWWQLELRGRCREELEGEKKRGGCAKTQETLHEKRQKEDKW